jgi:hypothetical protein
VKYFYQLDYAIFKINEKSYGKQKTKPNLYLNKRGGLKPEKYKFKKKK